ncbi:MAG: NADH-quinone oxidoreductase subunit N [Planctomycetes bacterium]|nr:NADH-quinone oxidoreductase subunit N [Planctomycetota bacterium]
MEWISAGRFAELSHGFPGDLVAIAPEVALATAACAVLLLDLGLGGTRGRGGGVVAALAWVAAVVALHRVLGAVWPGAPLAAQLALDLGGVLVFGLMLAGAPNGWVGLVALVGTLYALELVLARSGDPAASLFRAMLVTDRFATFFKVVLLLGTAATILASSVYRPMEDRRVGEFHSVLLLATMGMFLMVGATDAVMVYMSIELVSIASFVLVAWPRGDRSAAEASLKYIVYSAVASGVMVYGLSLFYGMTGSTNLADLTRFTTRGQPEAGVVAIASFLVLAGFGYKMAMVPFHFWAPDVYQGAPTPVTAYLSVTSKAAGVAIFARFVHAFTGGPSGSLVDWTQVVAVLAALTMTLGNLAALWQGNLKRMLAYSSVAHVGYVLMGVAAWDAPQGAGLNAAAFYLLVYFLMNMGAFAVVLLVADQVGSEEVETYRGLGSRAPFTALAMSVFLIALIGLPPTAGFVGKFQLFAAAIDHVNGVGRHDLVWLAVVAGVNTAISVYYYMRVVKNMWLEHGEEGVREPAMGPPILGHLTVLMLLVPVLWLGVFFGRVAQAARSLSLY